VGFDIFSITAKVGSGKGKNQKGSSKRQAARRAVVGCKKCKTKVNPGKGESDGSVIGRNDDSKWAKVGFGTGGTLASRVKKPAQKKEMGGGGGFGRFGGPLGKKPGKNSRRD